MRRTERLFVAIVPGRAAAARLDALAHALRRNDGLHGTPIGAERYHVTLCFLGDFTAGEAAALMPVVGERLDVRGFVPFDLSFDRVTSFRRRRGERSPVVLLANDGFDAMAALHDGIGESIGGATGRATAFTPHLTLMYDEARVAERTVEPIRWTVREVVLVHSAIGQRRHTVLGRWPLLS